MVPESGGGPAGGDGVLEPDVVASELLAAMSTGKFLILPHPEVGKYFQRKAGDYDRWLKGMQRMHQSFGKLVMGQPNLSNAKL